MGTYNTLIAKVQCSNCACSYDGAIQFKYGDVWQHDYQIGHQLKWGGNSVGAPGARLVKVYGILESDICPGCHQINEGNEFDIYVTNDTLSEVVLISNKEDYLRSVDNYCVLQLS